MKKVQLGLTLHGLFILAVLLTIMFRMFFFKSDSGIIHSSYYKGPDAYVRLSDGREIRTTRCEKEIGQGNTIEFTTLGFRIGSQQILPSVVVRCHISGWVLEGPLP